MGKLLEGVPLCSGTLKLTSHIPTFAKLVLRSLVIYLTYAERSMNGRMKYEIIYGMKALNSSSSSIVSSSCISNEHHNVINTNKGGPYGSKVLRGVLDISDQVWKYYVFLFKVGRGWYRSMINHG